MKFELVPGRKGPNDVLVKIHSYGEVLSFSDLLFILDKYFQSENSYYPKERGFLGSTMLLEAIVEVHSNIPLNTVLEHFRLNRKTQKTVIVSLLGPQVKQIEKLHEVME